MAFGCKQYVVELDVPTNDTVLMQEFQGQADLGCVKPGTCISIGEVLASNLVGAFLNCTLASATNRGGVEGTRAYLDLATSNCPP